MSDFRIRYGLAYGPEGTWAANSGRSLFTSGDTSPDVSTGTIFYTQNTSVTAITYFDVYGAGGISGDAAHEGKEIKVFFSDGSTGVTASSVLQISGPSGTIPAGTWGTYLLHNSAWYETDRIVPSSAGAFQTSTNVGGTIAPDVTNKAFYVLFCTAATTLVGLSGGYTGQIVTIMKDVANLAGTALTIQAANNLLLANTTAYVMTSGGASMFLCESAPRWRQITSLP